MKNFKRQLKKEAETHTPDLYEDIMSSAENLGLFDGERGQSVDAGGGTVAVKRDSKTFLYSVCAFALAAAVTLGIVLPLTLKKTDFPSLSPFELSVDDFYGAGALSSVKLLSDGARAVKSRASDTVSTVKDDIGYFNRYLSAFDAFLGEGFIDTVAADNTNPHYAQYEKTITVNTAGLDGTGQSYVMYYNETLKNNDGEERSYVLSGVMTLDGEEYLLRGERSIENDDDEHEEELKIRAYTQAHPENFVEMKQEVSVEDGEHETEYVYRVYSDNKLMEETSVEFETETKNGKTQKEFEVEFRKGGAKGKYKLKREEKNGATEISVKYDADGKQGKFKINEIVKDGKTYYEYTFEDGSKTYIEK